MATAAKFAGAEREKLFAQLEVHSILLKSNGGSCAHRTTDARAQSFHSPIHGLHGSAQPAFTPRVDTRVHHLHRAVLTAWTEASDCDQQVLVATAVTIGRLGSHTAPEKSGGPRKRSDCGGCAGLQRPVVASDLAVSLSLRRDLGAFERARRTGCAPDIAGVGVAAGSDHGSANGKASMCVVLSITS